jgi:sulfur transfer protein SufE
MCQKVAAPNNITATLINLIQFGDSWATETNPNPSAAFDRFRKGDKVPGCMADVRITTTFNYDSPLGNPKISVEGSADSRVAQGILALLCQVSSTVLENEIV